MVTKETVTKWNASGSNKGETMVKCKIPVNKTEELVIVSNEDIVNIEKYEGDQRVEFPLRDLGRVIDALIFIDTQENKFPKWKPDSNK